MKYISEVMKFPVSVRTATGGKTSSLTLISCWGNTFIAESPRVNTPPNDYVTRTYVPCRACARGASRGRLAQPRLGCVLKLGALVSPKVRRKLPPPSIHSTTHSAHRTTTTTMKLFWAVGALLLSCWRATASTGKRLASAILARYVILVGLCPSRGHQHDGSRHCSHRWKHLSAVFFLLLLFCH